MPWFPQVAQGLRSQLVPPQRGSLEQPTPVARKFLLEGER